MVLYYFENGRMREIDHYDPLPDYDREERRMKMYRRRSEHFHERW